MNDKKSIDEMKSYYDRRAPWHDAYMSYQGLDKMEELFSPIIKIIESTINNQSVLEIACGTGNWTQLLAKRAKGLTAIDASKESLSLAKKKTNEFQNISLICKDAYSLESLDKTFDVIIAVDWFSHIPKSRINSFLSMLQLISKAKTSIIFIGMLETQYFKEEMHRIDDGGNRISTRELPDGSSFDVIKNFQTENELRDIFSTFGQYISYTKFNLLQRWMIRYQQTSTK